LIQDYRLRKFLMIKATTCGDAIEAFAETCQITEPSTDE